MITDGALDSIDSLDSRRFVVDCHPSIPFHLAFAASRDTFRGTGTIRVTDRN